MDFITKTLKRPARIAALGLLSLFLFAPAALAETVQCAVPKDLSNPDDNSGKCGSHSPTNAVSLTAEGQYADFTATPKAGYVFKYWQNVGDKSITDENPLRVAYSDSIALLQLRACFAPTYDVTLNPCDGTWPHDATNLVRVVYGEPYGKLDSPYLTGYRFDGWFTAASSGEQVTASTIVTDVSIRTLYAHWSGIQSTLTFEVEGGTFANPSEKTRTVTYGSPYGTLPEASMRGYSLFGWFKDPDDNTTRIAASNLVDEVSDFSVYAKWSPIKYSVDFDGNGATSGEMAPMTKLEYGKKYTLSPSEFVRPGSKFLGWNTQADGSGSSYTNCADFSNLTTNNNEVVTLYAQWREAAYYVHFLPGGGSGSMDDQHILCDVDAALAPNAFVHTGYTFVSWRDDANGTNYLDGAIVRDLFADGETNTLVATWAPVNYSVSFKRGVATARGEMDDLPCVYDSPTNLTPCSFTNPLGTFLGWSRDPAAPVPEFADEAVVTNLATTAGAVVPLYAVWDTALTDLSDAIGCDTLKLYSTGPNPWTVTNYAGFICLMSGYYKSSKLSELTAKADGPGTLSFEWCVSGSTNRQRTVTQKGVKIGSGGDPQPVTNDVAAITIGEWYSKIVPVTDSASLDVIWYSSAYPNEGQGPEYDEGRLFIKNVAWIPDADSNLVYTVRFDPNGGSGEMADKTCLTGVAATLPSNAFFYDSDHDFDHWHDPLNNRDYPDGATVVDLAPGGGTNTLVAVWTTPEVIDEEPGAGQVPPGGLSKFDELYVYDGDGHTVDTNAVAAAFAEEFGVEFSFVWENAAPAHTNVGEYVMRYRAKCHGYVDFEHDVKLTITNRPVTVAVKGHTATYTYDGEEKTVEGFDLRLDDALYETNKMSFSGSAEARRTDVGTEYMGLNASQFANNDENFSVTYEVEDDGWVKITPSKAMEALAKAFGGLPATIAPDGQGGWTVHITNDIDSAALPVELPDDIGAVTIDLNGYDLVAEYGKPAIAILRGEGDGKPTEIAVVTPDGADATVQGGEWASAITVAEDAMEGVVIDIGAGVTVRGGDDFTPAIDGEVRTNEGTVVEPSRTHIPLRAGEYFKATLAELGYNVPTNGTAYSVKAYGLPSGLQLKYNAAVKNKKGKVVTKAKSTWWIEGVPTAAVDLLTNPAYLVITVGNAAETFELPLHVRPQDIVPLDDLALGQTVNEQYYLPGVTKGWTVSGLPTGLKYTAKLLTTKKKSGKKTVVVTNALPYSVYGKTTKAGLFTVTAKKKVGAFYETMKYRVLVNPAPVDASRFGDALTNITTMAYVPVDWDLMWGGECGGSALPAVSSVGGKVAKVTGLPTGLSFAASDTYAYKNAKKKTGKYLKQAGQTIVGKPTKTGTYVVTFTKNVKSGGKTVAKTAQILWKVVTNSEALSLDFNTDGGVGVVKSGVVGLKYTDLMEFAATSNATVTASGLPAGITLAKLDDSGEYAFTGYTAKAGTYLVTVKATLNGKTVTQRVALKVEALPSWAKGTFNGYVADEDGATNGLATVTVSAAGKLSGKFYDRGTNWTVTAASFTAAARPESAPYQEFIASNVVAKYYYKVKEKVKVKGKWKTKTVTKYATRSFTLTVGQDDDDELGGTATLSENGGDTTVYAWQNLWGSSAYKAVGRRIFYTSSKKQYKIFTIKGTDPAGAAMGLAEAMTLSLKVTPAGAVTATLSFGSAKYTCSTVVIPQTSPNITPFEGIAYLYFAPKGSFPGFAAAAQF